VPFFISAMALFFVRRFAFVLHLPNYPFLCPHLNYIGVIFCIQDCTEHCTKDCTANCIGAKILCSHWQAASYRCHFSSWFPQIILHWRNFVPHQPNFVPI